jgi:hypothetical protein
MPSTCPAILRTETEFAACVPRAVAQLFWPRAKADRGISWVLGQQAALRAGGATIESAYVFRLVPLIETTPGVTTIGPGGAVQMAGQVVEEAQPRSLAEANWYYATELLSEVPDSFARDLAGQLQVRQDISQPEMRAAVALIVAGVATQQNELLPEVIARETARAGAGASFWEKFSSGWNKLWTNPGQWLQRVFITEPGKAIQWAGRQILTATQNTWVRWLVDPLGIARVFGRFFEQLGRAMVDGSISTFDERSFMLTVADHWRRVGAALAVAAPLLPPPFNLIAIGLAALFTAAGVAVQYLYAQAEAEREAEKRAAQSAALAAAAKAKARELSEQQAQEQILGPETETGLDTRLIAGLGLAAVIILLGSR